MLFITLMTGKQLRQPLVFEQRRCLEQGLCELLQAMVHPYLMSPMQNAACSAAHTEPRW